MTYRKLGGGEIGIDVDDTLIPEGVWLDMRDVDSFIPYLSERWPPGGVPHRMEQRLNPHTGEQLYFCMVFRIPAQPQEPDPDAPRLDWDAMRQQVIRDRPRKRRKPEPRETPEA
ncbi:hypothetical protein [Mycolicibacterium mageritense]|uniref:hypothetical protein n=1 Tax=Mycolicibacterium mageritense TaxID=53462 RepID=UPI0011DC3A6E|nr:hypothetical protein [Mycolicibacterium mageritense]TXI59716.1 MAG: hypothetical protein E6Q55_21150 [Mycolicibacterium mageritense]